MFFAAAFEKAREIVVFSPLGGIEGAGDAWRFVSDKRAVGAEFGADAQVFRFVGVKRHAGFERDGRDMFGAAASISMNSDGGLRRAGLNVFDCCGDGAIGVFGHCLNLKRRGGNRAQIERKHRPKHIDEATESAGNGVWGVSVSDNRFHRQEEPESAKNSDEPVRVGEDSVPEEAFLGRGYFDVGEPGGGGVAASAQARRKAARRHARGMGFSPIYADSPGDGGGVPRRQSVFSVFEIALFFEQTGQFERTYHGVTSFHHE